MKELHVAEELAIWRVQLTHLQDNQYHRTSLV